MSTRSTGGAPGAAPGPTGTRYVVMIDGVRRDLEPEGVIWWVRGVADSRGGAHRLLVLDPAAPEDTNRVQALQIGEQAGWFEYLFMDRGADV